MAVLTPPYSGCLVFSLRQMNSGTWMLNVCIFTGEGCKAASRYQIDIFVCHTVVASIASLNIE